MVTKQIDHSSSEIIAEDIENGNEMPNGFYPKIKEMFRYSFIEFLQDISKWLIIGLLISALIAAIIPDDFFAVNLRSNFIGMLIILVISGPVYICATASVSLAAVLMMKGFSPGAALVLLMAGPATNAATITMIGKVLGKKSLISYLGTIITGALLAGLFIDYILPPEWFKLSEHFGHMGHNHQEMLPLWLKTGSAILLSLLILNGYLQKYLTSRKIKMEAMTSSWSIFNSDRITTIQVGGMTCNHCKENVENSIRSVKGVEEVDVDLTTGIVNIKGKSIDMKKILSGIKDIGYQIKSEDI